jgi:hypothetical protein
MTWESAFVPCISMLVAAALYHAGSADQEQRNLVQLFLLVTGKLYILGILRAVNARAKLRTNMHSDSVGRRSLGGTEWAEDATVVGRDGDGGGTGAPEKVRGTRARARSEI